MCGIAGIITQDKNRTQSLTPALDLMLDLMKHRGPDARGREQYDTLLLGHLRLSILDLSPRGRQPMVIDQGRLVISFNGEIYNYLELRRELEAYGAVFTNDTDTEVILQAYNHWGWDCFARFNGMWALAIWDRDRRQVILSRDRLGIKPLYWCSDGGVLAFASEIKALAGYRRFEGRPLEVSPAAVQNYLNRGQVDGAEETFFTGIYRFNPGHFMVIQDGAIRGYRSYWDLKKQAKVIQSTLADDRLKTEGRLFETLRDAVHIHTRSDVPVGVCLSGGLDSSSVAGLASERIDRLKSFTAWYEEDGDYNELEHADRIRDCFGLQSYPTLVSGDPLLEKLPDILWYLDEPTLAMGVYPQWHVMEAAAKEVKVVMDGQGGDEIFAGYDFYAARFLYSQLVAGNTKKYQEVLNGYYQNYGLARANALGQEVKSLFMSGAEPRHEHLNGFLFQELTSSRLPALLRYEDRLSMAFSIESRVPLLDYRLVELAFALKEEEKIGPGWSKHILRRALDGFLPPEVTWRKDKKGFPTPFDRWADGLHKQSIREVLHSRHSHLARSFGGRMLESFFQSWDQGKKDHWVLWRLLSLETWLGSYLVRLSQEMEASLKAKTPPVSIDPAAALARPNPIEAIVTIDYETFDTNDFVLDTQYRLDWQESVIGPTENLAALLERHGAKLTVLWDTVEYFWLEDHGHTDVSQAIRQQLQGLVRRGHDVQLHLHPAWTAVRRENGRWIWENPGLTAPAMRSDDFDALVKRSIDTMESLFKPIRPDYAVRGFRGRSYEVEPFSVIADTLKKHGIRADSSYHGYGPMPAKAPQLVKPVNHRNADFLEYPILAHNNRRWDFSSSPDMAGLPLEVFNGEPPAVPPFGPALVLIGHSKQQIHFQELDRCLAELKNRFKERLHFCRWQESIDRRLQIMQGDWMPEQGFSNDWFEQRWQEDDPFSSMQVQDPYYNRLMDLLPQEAASVLDLGCAEGGVTNRIARQVNAGRVLGVDISGTAVARAKTGYPQYEFREADLLKLNLKERFDLIFSSENIIYFHPAERAVIFGNMEAMLNPGGRVSLSWWSDARRGFKEETIEEEFGRFFRIVHAETYQAPAGTAIKGAHRILVGRRRLSLDEERVLKSVYWRDKRVVCLSARSDDLQKRFGWLSAQWSGDLSAPADLLITDRLEEQDLQALKINGAVISLTRDGSVVDGLRWILFGDGIKLGVKLHAPRPNLPASGDRKHTLVVVNDPARLTPLIDRLNRAAVDFRVTTLNKDIIQTLRDQALPVLDPKELGLHYFREKRDWGNFYPEQQAHYQIFNQVMKPVTGHPDIGQWKGYDLYLGDDYNQAYTVGINYLYLIDLLTELIEKDRPDQVISLDGDSESKSLVTTMLHDLSGVLNFDMYEVAGSGPAAVN